MRNLLQSVIDSLADAVLVTDANGIVRMVNPRTETMFKAEKAQIVGRVVEDFMPERFREKHSKVHRPSYNADPRHRPMGEFMDLYGQRTTGEEFPIEASLSPVTIDGENMIIVTVADITSRKAIETDLRKQIEVLDEYSQKTKEKSLIELVGRLQEISKRRA